LERPQLALRARTAVAAAGALGATMIPAAGTPTVAQAQTQGEIQATVQDATLRYGRAVVVSGTAPGPAGTPVALQFRPASGQEWRTLGTTVTADGGGFRLASALRSSGAVRAVSLTAGAADAGPSVLTSAARSVRVRAHVATSHVRRNVSAGRALLVRGALRPGGAGRTVKLQLHRDGRWRTVDRDRTAGDGGYVLRGRVASGGRARVRFAGDGRNTAAKRALGRIEVLRAAFASWYGPGLYGNPMACGGTLTPGTVGVAHKTLPCGAVVTVRYRGRAVRAPVVDRGPFVGGREFDLTAATARALGFGSLGWVRVST